MSPFLSGISASLSDGEDEHYADRDRYQETGNETPDPEHCVADGTLRIAVEAASDGLNPTANNFAQAAYMMGYAIYDPLFYVDTDGQWFPFLAESAEPLGDGSTWEVKVREGITFHDGTPLNADALIAQLRDGALTDPLDLPRGRSPATRRTECATRRSTTSRSCATT